MLNPFQKAKLTIKTAQTFEPIKEKPSILKVFGHYYPENSPRKTSRAFLALCPIHGENNPSFAMYPETDSYYCFACQATGDSYKLIMELENCDFKTALDIAKFNNLYD